ncbi:MAG: 50S ribosomal protein L4 [Acidobacteria bacterium]|nr:50S ribosomal protein L4 [Acidobacteriota bacterium]
MNIDVVNDQNEKVGSMEFADGLAGGPIDAHLIWESVVHANAAARRGTHATKTRGLVSGTGKKPWRQKGTGRARVGDSRNPLWRKGGVVFGPQPRSYDYRVPKKVERGALRAALVQKVRDGALVVVDRLAAESGRTKAAVELLQRLGAGPKALLVDVTPDAQLQMAVRNLAGVRFVSSQRVTARDIAVVPRVIATKAAVERLQEVVAR